VRVDTTRRPAVRVNPARRVTAPAKPVPIPPPPPEDTVPPRPGARR